MAEYLQNGLSQGCAQPSLLSSLWLETGKNKGGGCCDRLGSPLVFSVPQGSVHLSVPTPHNESPAGKQAMGRTLTGDPSLVRSGHEALSLSFVICEMGGAEPTPLRSLLRGAPESPWRCGL